MSKDLYIRILKPISGYTENRVYDDHEVTLQSVRYRNLQEEDFAQEGDFAQEEDFAQQVSYPAPKRPYFRKLKVRSVYANMDDIIGYLSEKYSLGEIKNYSLQYNHDHSETLMLKNEKYTASEQEIKALEKPHIHEGMYCDVYKDFSLDIYMGNVLSKLVEQDFEIINDALIDRAIRLVSEEYCDEDEDDIENALESCFAYDMGSEGKLFSALLAARELAKRVGGMAILEYD